MRLVLLVGSRCSSRAISNQALDLARYGGYAYFNNGDVHDAADAWVARARAKAANDSWEETLPQVVPGMEVEGWGGRKMQNAVNTSLHGGIELCGINALRDAADGEGGFFFSGPIRLGLPCAQVRREVVILPLSTRRLRSLCLLKRSHILTRSYTPLHALTPLYTPYTPYTPCTPSTPHTPHTP